MEAYLSPYVVVAVVALAGVGFVALAYGANRLLAPSRPTREKLLTYESGVDPVGDGWAHTHVRYYVYAFLYVVFAVDAVFCSRGRPCSRRPGSGSRHWSRCSSSSACWQRASSTRCDEVC